MCDPDNYFYYNAYPVVSQDYLNTQINIGADIKEVGITDVYDSSRNLTRWQLFFNCDTGERFRIKR